MVQVLTLERRTAWINAICRKQWVPGSGARVCSVHFISGKPAALYDKHNPDWIPNQKMGYEVSNIVNVDRYQRNKRSAQSTSPAAHYLTFTTIFMYSYFILVFI